MNDSRVPISTPSREKPPQRPRNAGKVRKETSRHVDGVAAALGANIVAKTFSEHPKDTVSEGGDHKNLGERAQYACLNLKGSPQYHPGVSAPAAYRSPGR